MKVKVLIQNLIFLFLCFFLTSCGGGSSNSGSDSDSGAIHTWIGPWRVTGVAPQVCPGDRSVVSGNISLSQDGEEIVGSYKISVTCSVSQSSTASGTLASRSISDSKLVLVDDEGDIFTFIDESGVITLQINNPEAGNILTIVALR